MEESRVRYTAIREERDQLRGTHADQLKQRDSAWREALQLRVRVIELESETAASTIRAADIAEAVHERDLYLVVLQLVAAQVLGLQDSYAGIVSRAKSS